MEELDTKFRARTQRLVEFTVLANNLTDPKRKRIPSNLIKGVEDFRLSFETMRDDPRLKSIAQLHLEMINEVVLYAKSKNAGETEQAERHLGLSIKLHDDSDKLIYGLINEGSDAV